MRIAILLAAALLAGCKSSGPRADAPVPGALPAEPQGDPALMAQLELTDARLEHSTEGAAAVFTLHNRGDQNLRLEFCVLAYGRSGAVLPGGRTAWVLLELGPHAAREVRTASLPSQTESWRLAARKGGG
jgi:hypothetical protein